MYSVQNLHFGFRRRANKVESLQNRNFFVEQIDDYLDEATKVYIREVSKLFEVDQTKIDDLRQLVKSEIVLTTTPFDKYVEAELPTDYYRMAKKYALATRTDCKDIKRIKLYPIQSDDEEDFLSDDLYKPSFIWNETGYRLIGNKIRVWTNDEFNVGSVVLDYIYKHPRIANPLDSRNGTYSLPDGTVAVQQDLILDSTNQPECIMDIAVLMAYMDISDPAYQIKLQKIINAQNYVNK